MLRLIIGLQSFNQPRGALLLLASILAMHGRTATLMKCARKFREIGKSASIIFGIFTGCKQYHEIGLEFWPFSPRNARDKRSIIQLKKQSQQWPMLNRSYHAKAFWAATSGYLLAYQNLPQISHTRAAFHTSIRPVINRYICCLAAYCAISALYHRMNGDPDQQWGKEPPLSTIWELFCRCKSDYGRFFMGSINKRPEKFRLSFSLEVVDFFLCYSDCCSYQMSSNPELLNRVPLIVVVLNVQLAK